MSRWSLIALLALGCAAAVACIGGDSGDADATATPNATAADAAPAATAVSQPTATPTPAPASTPEATATPTETAVALPVPGIDGVPFSLADFAAALPTPGMRPADEFFEPSCPGAGGEPVAFIGPDGHGNGPFGGGNGPHPVWVLWVYADHEAFERDWEVDENFRVSPLLDGCEPPTGWVYWNENLVLWFAGLYGANVEPGTLPSTADEVREHPVLRTFLELTWQ